jgi:hypothetical protein
VESSVNVAFDGVKLFYTLPNWTELVMDPIHQAGGNISVIIITYAFMMFSQMMHTVSLCDFREFHSLWS